MKTTYRFWGLPLLLLASQAQSGVLDQKLESLYSQVSAKFEANAWFRNDANQDLSLNPNRAGSMPPEFQMPSLDDFKVHMKSYCVLLESPFAKKISRPSRYSVVDYDQQANFRRLYVYDTKTKEFIHNTWTTHGTPTYPNVRVSLKNTSSGYDKSVLNFSDQLSAEFFSNEAESNQSSVGMTYSDPSTYWSNTFSCNALRMNGVDGDLNSKLLSRAVVVHAFDYSAVDIRDYRLVPSSWGCVMLQRKGFYQGQPDAPIADLIIKDMTGGPILLYHERMKPEVNESTYQDQVQAYTTLQLNMMEKMREFAMTYEWTPEQLNTYENEVSNQLKKSYLDRVEQTYRYFKTPSKFVGKEPKSEAACLKALNM